MFPTSDEHDADNFRLSADSHLFLALVDTVKNGCMLVFVLETHNGTIIVCFHVFYDVLVCQFKRFM